MRRAPDPRRRSAVTATTAGLRWFRQRFACSRCPRCGSRTNRSRRPIDRANRGCIVIFQPTPQRVGKQLLGNGRGELRFPRQQSLPQFPRTVDVGAVQQNTRGVDRAARIRCAPLSDRVEILQTQSQRIHTLVATRARRIRAVLRRQEMGQAARIRHPERGGYRFHGWRLERRRRRLVDANEKSVALSKGEYALLLAFLESPQRSLSREYLLRATRVHEDIFDRSIDVQILRLRRKLEVDPDAPRVIQTERGVGYVFALPVGRF